MKLPRGIRKRGESYIVDVTYKGKRVTSTCHTLKEAKERQAKLKASLKSGRSVSKHKRSKSSRCWTLGKAVEVTRTSHWAGTKSETTTTINSQALLDYFGENCRLDAINAMALDRFVDHLKAKGNADATVNRKLVCLRKVMAIAFVREGCKVIPKMPKKKEHKGRIRYLTQREETNLVGLLRQWGKDNQADAVVILVDTGMRLGELLRITHRDVDLKLGVISIWVTKADRPRSIPMTKRVRAIIEARMTGLEADHTRLFPENQYWLRYSWDRAREHMGLGQDGQFVIHALRHTCASRLVQRGVSLKVVQEWLGHTDITTTMRYAHLSPTGLLEAVGVLEEETEDTLSLPSTQSPSKGLIAGSSKRRLRPKRSRIP